MAISETTRQQISDLVSTHHVLLFMKGTRGAPQCGFSAQVVQMLDDLVPSYETVNVLESPELREGIKEYSQWPTIPQLFVAGELVGGCDIVRELHAAGELPKLLGVDDSAPPQPSITLSEAAERAFRGVLGDAGDDVLRLKISADFRNDLFFGPREPGDIEVVSRGLILHLDRATARRADGLQIDFIEQTTGGGFKLENPNAPAGVKQIEPQALAALLAEKKVLLFDVRPARERALASIPGDRALDDEGQAFLMQLDKSAAVAFYCHHGIRSRAVAEQLLAAGFSNVLNLAGGVDAWSQTVDPKLPRY